MTKFLPLPLLPLAAALAIVIDPTPVQSATVITSTATVSTRSCSVRPARDTGFIRAAGQTVRIIAPERTVCSWTPSAWVHTTTILH